ncbi:hypothetical protein DOTSEDRAFT_74909 [Dothistroma septosporum NZE10]|uniref:Letm1 RBD domain-containing protein n=1 Tax=Dothistroma septosporum (strain NZE10 / CBS 128990) TaxID=675120 RepID=N1PDT6_DOTSN|nr:hypothetical protein DOTSEDRAFT_74909 [Dothistroma septosporum NZE10]
MTTRWPSAVSSLRNHHNARLRISRINTPIRSYASKPHLQLQEEDVKRHEKAALVEITGLRRIDPVNPPRSTLPPPLKFPSRGDANIALYYFRIGRAYGSFYWVGIKAVWFNYKASQALRERVKKDARAESTKSLAQATWLKHLSRSEFQLLERNNHDIGKLPFFGLLVALFGEWLPLLVPFIPGAVPGTCRIPKQTEGMRAKAEERRRFSFRRGISEPTREEMLNTTAEPEDLGKVEWPLSQKEYAAILLQRLRDDQLFHLSCTLNLHNRLWDRVQLPPPSTLLRRGLSKRLAYIASDDKLLIRDGGASQVSSDELNIACEERGLDVLGKREDTLRHDLSWWLARQEEDQGKGSAIFTMLFRRPNAWKTVTKNQTMAQNPAEKRG